MKESKYAQLDAELLRLINAGKNRLMLLEENRPLLEMAKPFCVSVSGKSAPPEWRIIDRRLQSLRKAGKIGYDGKVWKLL